MTSEARVKELAAMLANHPFLALAVDEINGLEQENAGLRKRVGELEGTLRKCLTYLTTTIDVMRRHPELIPEAGLVEAALEEEVRTALSQASAQAKLENQPQTPAEGVEMSETTTAKTVEEMEEIAQFLFRLLDDIDTLDDAAKDDDKAFRDHARRVQQRRFEVASTDGYKVWWVPGENAASAGRMPAPEDPATLLSQANVQAKLETRSEEDRDNV